MIMFELFNISRSCHLLFNFLILIYLIKKIILYAFKLASLDSFESKNYFELSTEKWG